MAGTPSTRDEGSGTAVAVSRIPEMLPLLLQDPPPFADSLKKWCTRAMRCKLEPMKKFVRPLRVHEDLLMNFFKAHKAYSSSTVEG